MAPPANFMDKPYTKTTKFVKRRVSTSRASGGGSRSRSRTHRASSTTGGSRKWKGNTNLKKAIETGLMSLRQFQSRADMQTYALDGRRHKSGGFSDEKPKKKRRSRSRRSKKRRSKKSKSSKKRNKSRSKKRSKSKSKRRRSRSRSKRSKSRKSRK